MNIHTFIIKNANSHKYIPAKGSQTESETMKKQNCWNEIFVRFGIISNFAH